MMLNSGKCGRVLHTLEGERELGSNGWQPEHPHGATAQHCTARLHLKPKQVCSFSCLILPNTLTGDMINPSSWFKSVPHP